VLATIERGQAFTIRALVDTSELRFNWMAWLLLNIMESAFITPASAKTGPAAGKKRGMWKPASPCPIADDE